MRVTITNRAGHLLLCPLNSGKTIHLAPAAISEPLDELEIAGNEKVDKLLAARLISVTAREPGAGDPRLGPGQAAAGSPAAIADIGVAKAEEAAPVATVENATAAAAEARAPKASLSRLQFLVFTFVIAGLYLMLSIQAATFVDIPTNVLGLLGVSAGSYVVSKAMG